MHKDEKLTGPVLMVAASETSPVLRYVTPVVTHDPIVCLQWGCRRWLVVPLMEKNRARRTDPAARVLTPDMLPLARGKRRNIGGWARGLLRMVRVRRVTVASDFPVGVARELEHGGIRINVARGALFPSRAVKTPRELRAIAGAQRAAAAGIKTAVALLRAARIGRGGVLYHGGRALTSECVRRAIHRTLLDHECRGSETIVAGGVQGADPHCIGSGPLRAGQPIVLDIFPRSNVTGYWGDITRTVVKGTVPAEWRGIMTAVKAAHAKALATLRPRMRCGDIHAAAAAELERRGYKSRTIRGRPAGFIHGTGHGVGLEIHEAPRIGRGQATRLKPGHVITIEPGLYYPGRGGVRFEDLIVVTRRGWRRLAACPASFRIP